MAFGDCFLFNGVEASRGRESAGVGPSEQLGLSSPRSALQVRLCGVFFEPQRAQRAQRLGGFVALFAVGLTRSREGNGPGAAVLVRRARARARAGAGESRAATVRQRGGTAGGHSADRRRGEGSTWSD